MKTKMDESKTVQGPTPAPLSDAELEKLTAPSGIAHEAFQGGAQAVTAGSSAETTTLVVDPPAPPEYVEKTLAEIETTQKSWVGGLAQDRVSELRTEVMPMLDALRSQLEDLNKRAMAVGIGGDVMLTIMRGTIYCPECKQLLDGGSMTSQFDSPYVHPSGSAAPKDCKYKGKKFEKPRVFTRVLG